MQRAAVIKAANKRTTFLCQILEKCLYEILIKWATAVAPVRIRSGVVTVPVERAVIRAVVHVTARDNHRPRVLLFPYI